MFNIWTTQPNQRSSGENTLSNIQVVSLPIHWPLLTGQVDMSARLGWISCHSPWSGKRKVTCILDIAFRKSTTFAIIFPQQLTDVMYWPLYIECASWSTVAFSTGTSLVTFLLMHNYPDSKVVGANIGPIWGRQDPGGFHVGPMKFAIGVILQRGIIRWSEKLNTAWFKWMGS